MTDADQPPSSAVPVDANSPDLPQADHETRNTADTPDVFVSYTRADRAFVAKLVDTLKTAGYRVWWDSELKSGPYEPVIRSLLRSVKCVVVVWSEAAATSEWVQAEAEIGRERKVLVQALQCKPEFVPLPFNRHNYVDFSDWTQSPTDPALKTLLEHVHALILDNPLPTTALELTWWQKQSPWLRWLLVGTVAALVFAGVALTYIRLYRCDQSGGFCVYANCFLHDPSNQIGSSASFEDCRKLCTTAGDRCRAFSYVSDDRGGSCMMSESYDDIRKRQGSRIGIDASLRQPTSQQLDACGNMP